MQKSFESYEVMAPPPYAPPKLARGKEYTPVLRQAPMELLKNTQFFEESQREVQNVASGMAAPRKQTTSISPSLAPSSASLRHGTNYDRTCWAGPHRMQENLTERKNEFDVDHHVRASKLIKSPEGEGVFITRKVLPVDETVIYESIQHPSLARAKAARRIVLQPNSSRLYAQPVDDERAFSRPSLYGEPSESISRENQRKRRRMDFAPIPAIVLDPPLRKNREMSFDVKKKRKKPKSDVRAFPCPKCDKAFTTRSLLTRHNMIHTDQRPHQCSVCAKRFRQREHLTKHFRLHTGERPFSCPHCAVSFVQKSTMTGHIRAKHTKERPVKCPKCGDGFFTRNHLRSHKRKCMVEPLVANSPVA